MDANPRSLEDVTARMTASRARAEQEFMARMQSPEFVAAMERYVRACETETSKKKETT